MAPKRQLQSVFSQAEESLRELWGPDLVQRNAELRAAVDRDIARTLVPTISTDPMSAVDELAALSKFPHLPAVLRRVASGSWDYDAEEFSRAVRDAIVCGPRMPEIAQEDLDAEIEAALADAAQGIPSPDLHDRVLELMHERDAGGIGWYPGRIPEVELHLRAESISAKPRQLRGTWPPKPPEPSVVDRLAATVDQVAAERVAKMDAARARVDEAADELRILFEPTRYGGEEAE